METGRRLVWCGRRDSAFERLNLFRLRLYFFRTNQISIVDLLKACRTIVTIYRETTIHTVEKDDYRKLLAHANSRNGLIFLRGATVRLFLLVPIAAWFTLLFSFPVLTFLGALVVAIISQLAEFKFARVKQPNIG